MVIVAFPPGEKYAVNYTTLDQYDYGQILRIQGLKLPKTVEVHFSTQETGGTSITRVGVTKDGVTDVLIPDSVLENGDTTQNYSIFAFVYITDATSGKTEYRAKLKVKARPKPEVPGGGDNPDIFHEAVLEVRKSAEKAEEAQRQAEGWAHGREDLPERAEDNAKYYCGKTSEDAKKTAEDRKEVERLVESVSGIDEQVTKVEELSKNAQEAATQAGTSAEQAELHKQAAETASSAAQTAAQETEADKVSVGKLSAQVQKNKESVDKTAQDFALNAQQALADVNNAGQTQTERVQTAGNTAVGNIQTAQNTATQAVETAKTEAVKTVQTEGTTQTGAVTAEGERQVQAVQTAAQEIVADREQITKNKTEIADLRQNKADAIVETASGTLLNVKDSSEAFFEDFSMSGKTTQDGTPTPDAPVEIVNAGRLNEDTGKYEVDVKVTGKNLINEKSLKNFENYTKQGSTYYMYRIRGLINGVQYTLSRGDVASGNKMIFGISVNGQTYDNSSFLVYDGLGSSYNRKSITWTQNNVDYADILFSYNANQSQTTAERLKELFDRIEYIQLEYGNSPTAHEVIKKSQSVMLTSDRPVTKWDKLLEQDGQIGWLYATKYIENLAEIIRDNTPIYGTEQKYFNVLFENEKFNYSMEKVVSETGHYKANKGLYTIDVKKNTFLIKINADDTIQTAKEHLHYSVMYNTTQTEFVPLPRQEQEAIRALQTYYPTTVVSNSEDMEMKLSYVADTKNYTDRKIEEAVSVQIQSLANLLSLMPDNVQAALIENDTNRILESEVNQ